MNEHPPSPPKLTYRLATARWHYAGNWDAQLLWSEVVGLDMTERGPLVEVAAHALKTPGVAAVKIVVYEGDREVKETVPNA